MAEIIDVLSPRIAKCPYFEAATGAGHPNFVLTQYGVGVVPNVQNGSNFDVFNRYDNFSILSVGFVIPEAFTLWRDSSLIEDDVPVARLDIFLKGETSGKTYLINSLGLNSGVYVPLENFEFAIDAFVSVGDQVKTSSPYTALDENFKILVSMTPVRVSMVGQPAALNGVPFYIVPFVKVAHNFVLGVTP